jgi:transposase
MRFVWAKTLEQQDIQALHRIRERLVSQRTRLCNQIRGLLGGYGLVIPQGIRFIRQQLPGLLEDGGNELTPIARESFQQLYEELVELDRRVKQTKQRIGHLLGCPSDRYAL